MFRPTTSNYTRHIRYYANKDSSGPMTGMAKPIDLHNTCKTALKHAQRFSAAQLLREEHSRNKYTCVGQPWCWWNCAFTTAMSATSHSVARCSLGCCYDRVRHGTIRFNLYWKKLTECLSLPHDVTAEINEK